MCAFIFLCFAVASPSHDDIFDAIVTNREAIRALKVHTITTRTLPNVQVVNKVLYLDVDAQRWRMDTTGPMPLNTSIAADKRPEFVKKIGVSDSHVYQYFPFDPRRVATVESLNKPNNPNFFDSFTPFPDPRNAGLVHVFHGNTGTPFEVGGTRISIYTGQLEPHKGEKVEIESANWKGVPCYKGKWEWQLDGPKSEKVVRQYVVVPEWGYTVVFLESKVYRENEASPYSTYSVETEASLERKSKIWFPTRVHYLATMDGKATQDELTEFELVSLNEPMQETEFNFKGMEVPIGHAVVDFIEHSPSKAWDGNKVVASERREPPLSTTFKFSAIRQWLLIFTSILVLCLAVAVWKKGNRRCL